MEKKKIKLLISVLSRANYARVKSVISAAKDSQNIETILVLGCSAVCKDYGDISEECINEGYVVNEKISSLMHEKSRENMVKTTALTMLDYSQILKKYNPDFTLTVADRYETIALAIASSYMNIPLIHLQGGEPTGCIDDKIRNCIAQMADYHFVCNKDAYKRTIRWGENESRVFNVGCPSLDHLKKYDNRDDINNEIEQINIIKKTNIDIDRKYVVFLYHPDTRKKSQEFSLILESIKNVCTEEDIDLIVFEPNPDAGSDEINEKLYSYNKKINVLNNQININFISHLESKLYNALIQGCEVLIGNSSSGIRESSYLGIKSLNIGERQVHRMRGENVIDTDISKENIEKSLKKHLSNKKPDQSFIYGEGVSGVKIISLINKLDPSIKSTKL